MPKDKKYFETTDPEPMGPLGWFMLFLLAILIIAFAIAEWPF